MREIGLIRWFGGYNLRTKKMNDFGFIRDNKGQDIYFNKGHVQCKLKELTPGIGITFERGVNFKNDREQAIRIKLLKDENDREIFYDFFNSKIFLELNLNDRSEILINIDENDVINTWSNYEEDLKIIFLYRLCAYNKEFKLIEKINEENEFIRAMLLLYWGKINNCNNEIIIKKAFKLFKGFIEIKNRDLKIVSLNNRYNKEKNKSFIIEFVKMCTQEAEESEELRKLLDMLQAQLLK
ncbi:hypothetical protein NL50_03220 [Clostridium acetobutylicum]|nr:hypothetical protein NL50_03220 [Clostridium acetobutylicum]